MIRRHHSREVNPADRGLAFGKLQSEAVAVTVSSYRRLFEEAAGIERERVRAFGRELAGYLTARWSHAVDEIEGIAVGAGQDADELIAINARTELLAGAVAPDCSVIGLTPEASSDGHCVLAQNWDWHPALAPSLVLWSMERPGNQWLVTLTEAGMLAKIGLNSEHLGCCLSRLETDADEPGMATPLHILLRAVLEQCGNLSDALGLLLNERVSASSCITLGYESDKRGAAVAVEMSPSGAQVVWPGTAGRLVHTNYFLVPPRQGVDLGPRKVPGGLVRQWELENRLATRRAPLDDRAVARLLQSHFNAPDGVCTHREHLEPWPEKCSTIASIVLDLTVGSMSVTDGPPCTAPLELVWPRQNASDLREGFPGADTIGSPGPSH